MPYLIELLQTGQQKIYQLKVGINKIGRQLDNEIVVNDYLVSRYHSQIIVNSDKTIIEDCQSRNHTFVNQVKITESVLNEGDQITIGKKNFCYTNTEQVDPFTIVVSKPNKTSTEEVELSPIATKEVKFPPIATKEVEFSSIATKEVESTPLIGQTNQKSLVKTVRKTFNIQEGDRLLDKILDKIVDPQSSKSSVIRVQQKNRKDRALEKLKLLLEVSQKLCSPQQPQQILSQVLELLLKVMDVDRGAILILNEETQELECQATKIRDGIESSDYIYSSNVVDLVWETGDAFVATDIAKDERFDSAESIIVSSIHGSMCVPLKVNNDKIGVIYVDNLSMGFIYSDEDLEFLAGLAAISATSIHMANTFNKREKELKKEITELKIMIDPEMKKRELEEAIGGLNLEHFQKVARNFRESENLGDL